MTKFRVSSFQPVLLLMFSIAGTAQTDHVTAFTGTWKLNLEKSTFPAGMAPKSFTIQFAPDGKTSASGTRFDGQPIAWSCPWSGGKEVPVDGIPMPEPTFTQEIRGNNVIAVMRTAGKIVMKLNSTVSADGKTQTSIFTEFDENGHSTQHKEFYEKQ